MPHYTKPLRKVIGKLKKASKAHAKQAKVLSKIEMGLGFNSPPVSDESMRFMFPYGTVRKGTILPQDYRTVANPAGTTDPKYYEGERGGSLTGYSSPFNTLGTYQYEYKMPTAPAFDNAAIVVTDKYDWNPMYGTVPEQNFTGYIGEGFGDVEGSDVDAKMLFEFVKNLIMIHTFCSLKSSFLGFNITTENPFFNQKHSNLLDSLNETPR